MIELVIAATVMAPQECSQRDVFVAHMKTYKETVIYRGTAGKKNEFVFELWHNHKTGSWTTAHTDIVKEKGKLVVRTCTGASGWNLKKKIEGDL